MPAAAILQFIRQVRCAGRDFLDHRRVPGYLHLSWRERQRLNALALAGFLRSAEGLRLALWLTAWGLLAQILIWRLDLEHRQAVWTAAAAAVWVWPWLASARRRWFTRLLRDRWPDQR